DVDGLGDPGRGPGEILERRRDADVTARAGMRQEVGDVDTESGHGRERPPGSSSSADTCFDSSKLAPPAASGRSVRCAGRTSENTSLLLHGLARLLVLVEEAGGVEVLRLLGLERVERHLQLRAAVLDGLARALEHDLELRELVVDVVLALEPE